MKRIVIILTAIVLPLLPRAAGAQQRSVSLTTYYPAPQAVFDRLRLVPFPSADALGSACAGQEGTFFIDSNDDQLRFCQDAGSGSRWGLVSGLWQRDQETLSLINPDYANQQVGIGITRPVAPLHLHCPQAEGSGLLVVDWAAKGLGVVTPQLVVSQVEGNISLIGEDDGDAQSAIHFIEVAPGSGNYIRSWAVGRNSSNGPNRSGDFYISQTTDAGAVDWWNNPLGRRLTIIPTGEVGIGPLPGSVSLNSALTIYNDNSACGGAECSASLRLEESSAAGDNDDVIWDLWALTDGANDRLSVCGGRAGSVDCDRNLATPNSERLVVTNQGRVGIGTTVPETQLHVRRPAGAGSGPELLLEQESRKFRLRETGGAWEYRLMGYPAVFAPNPAQFMFGSNQQGVEEVVGTTDYLRILYDGNAGAPANGTVVIGNYRSYSGPIQPSGIADAKGVMPALVVLDDGLFELRDMSIMMTLMLGLPNGSPGNDYDVRFYAHGGFAPGPDSGFMIDALDDAGVMTRILSMVDNDEVTTSVSNDARVFLGTPTARPIQPFQAESGAYVGTDGNFYSASSRDFKENIRELSLAEARDALQGLQSVSYHLKAVSDGGAPALGFIAEDVPDLVAVPGRKGIDPTRITAVLTRVVQDQQDEIERRAAVLEEQAALIEEIRSRLNDL